jgi:hypothetical protein
MNRHTGGHRFCPICKRIVETRVLANGYKQVRYGDGYAKQRKIVCAKDRYGNGGCGFVWYTFEIPQELLE